eukprot:359985-Chlamydomonas_euryale.AAC.22
MLRSSLPASTSWALTRTKSCESGLSVRLDAVLACIHRRGCVPSGISAERTPSGAPACQAAEMQPPFAPGCCVANLLQAAVPLSCWLVSLPLVMPIRCVLLSPPLSLCMRLPCSYQLLKRTQIEERSMSEFSKVVFEIIPHEKSEAIQMMYKLMYLESQVPIANGQASMLASAKE